MWCPYIVQTVCSNISSLRTNRDIRKPTNFWPAIIETNWPFMAIAPFATNVANGVSCFSLFVRPLLYDEIPPLDSISGLQAISVLTCHPALTVPPLLIRSSLEKQLPLFLQPFLGRMLQQIPPPHPQPGAQTSNYLSILSWPNALNRSTLCWAFSFITNFFCQRLLVSFLPKWPIRNCEALVLCPSTRASLKLADIAQKLWSL